MDFTLTFTFGFDTPYLSKSTPLFSPVELLLSSPLNNVAAGRTLPFNVTLVPQKSPRLSLKKDRATALIRLSENQAPSLLRIHAAEYPPETFLVFETERPDGKHAG